MKYNPKVLYQKSDKNEFQIVYKSDTTVIVTLNITDEIISENPDINSIKDSNKLSITFTNPVNQQNESCYELVIRKILSLTCKKNVSISYLYFDEINLSVIVEALNAMLVYAGIVQENEITLEFANKKRIWVNRNIIYEEECDFIKA